MSILNCLKIGFLLLMLFLVSCSDTHNYDVYVYNDTPHYIRVMFKSLKDENGIIQDSVLVGSKVQKKIISTVNFSSTERSFKPIREHCKFIAEYVVAYAGETQANLEWCDPSIDFVIEDIGEGRFTMVFKEEHFE